MKEFVFALDYDQGCNAIADTLAQHPDTRIRSLSCHVTQTSVWRVDHVSGTPDALDPIEETFLNPDHCTDCLATPNCGAESDNTVLDRDEDTLVIYSRWSKARSCTSVPHLALETLGDGLLFETTRTERRYQWRIVTPDHADISAFHNALQDEICTCTDIDFVRLTGIDSSPTDLAEESSMTTEQVEALTAAVQHGYYETPRAIDLDELSGILDIPRSTLSYRLRRAEAHLATSFVANEPTGVEDTLKGAEVSVRQPN